jgi:hypothetical protein
MTNCGFDLRFQFVPTGYDLLDYVLRLPKVDPFQSFHHIHYSVFSNHPEPELVDEN